jgi:sulfur-oxidizing protein SoxX
MRPALAMILIALAAPAGAGEVVGYKIVDGAIPAPLNGTPGDPARGEAIVRDASIATCMICHHLPIAGEPDMGDIGPDLTGVADRLSPGELRLRLVDARKINPDTVMPPYYSLSDLNRVGTQWQGKTIYSAQMIEDVLAFLGTLHEQ